MGMKWAREKGTWKCGSSFRCAASDLLANSSVCSKLTTFFFKDPWPFWSSGGGVNWRQKKLYCFIFLVSFQWVGGNFAAPISSSVCVISQEKSLETLRYGWELKPGHGEDRQWDTFILPLSYHNPGHREDTVRHIHSPTELWWHTERTDSEIHSFSHWAIMTWAMEWTDSEIPSFSHWAIMTWAMEWTDSEIPSFSHWAMMTRSMDKTDSEME